MPSFRSFGVRRVEGHEDRYMHIIDPSTQGCFIRGLILHYKDNQWDWVRREDVSGVEETNEAREDFLSKNVYMPIGVPREEFEDLYGKTEDRTLFDGEFDRSNYPTLRQLIEESKVDFYVRLFKRAQENLARSQNSQSSA